MMVSEADPSDASVTTRVAEYIRGALTRDVSDEVIDRAKMHLLDALVAAASGARLRAGRLAIQFATQRAARGDATIVGGALQTSPEMAALANGISCHGDETDDCFEPARMHPGASVVPASLALAESRRASGLELVKAVIVGYDVGCSFPLALWRPGPTLWNSIQAVATVGHHFGAVAAAGSLAGLTTSQLRHALSYTAQQVSGLLTFFKDTQHVEKAFVMSGMPAQHGVLAVELVAMGFSGVDNELDASPGLFDVWGEGGDKERLFALLGGEHQVLQSDIKNYPIGMPIHAPAQALEEIIAAEGIGADDVDRIVCRMPPVKARIVDDRPIPDINLQYILTLLLMERRIAFAAAHDYARLQDPQIRAVMSNITLIHDASMSPSEGDDVYNRAHLEVVLKDGRTLTKSVVGPFGTRLDPMNWDALERKVDLVLADVLEAPRIKALVSTVRDIESLADVRDIRDVLGA